MYEDLLRVVNQTTWINFDGIRCHEASRIIASYLRQFGKVRVLDGIAVYPTKVLYENHLSSDILKEIFFESEVFLRREIISYFHSWCEIETREEEIIVDFHPHFKLDKNIATKLLIVGDKSELPYEYFPVAHKIGRMIIWPDRIPPYIVILKRYQKDSALFL